MMSSHVEVGGGSQFGAGLVTDHVSIQGFGQTVRRDIGRTRVEDGSGEEGNERCTLGYLSLRSTKVFFFLLLTGIILVGLGICFIAGIFGNDIYWVGMIFVAVGALVAMFSSFKFCSDFCAVPMTKSAVETGHPVETYVHYSAAPNYMETQSTQIGVAADADRRHRYPDVRSTETREGLPSYESLEFSYFPPGYSTLYSVTGQRTSNNLTVLTSYADSNETSY